MGNLLDKLLNRNPKLEVFEIIETDGDFALVVGFLDKEDGPPSYMAVNTKYGLVEATTNRSKEMYDMFAYVRGVEPPTQLTGRTVDLDRMQ